MKVGLTNCKNTRQKCKSNDVGDDSFPSCTRYRFGFLENAHI